MHNINKNDNFVYTFHSIELSSENEFDSSIDETFIASYSL